MDHTRFTFAGLFLVTAMAAVSRERGRNGQVVSRKQGQPMREVKNPVPDDQALTSPQLPARRVYNSERGMVCPSENPWKNGMSKIRLWRGGKMEFRGPNNV